MLVLYLYPNKFKGKLYFSDHNQNIWFIPFVTVLQSYINRIRITRTTLADTSNLCIIIRNLLKVAGLCTVAKVIGVHGWRGRERERTVPCGAPGLPINLSESQCCRCTYCGLPLEWKGRRGGGSNLTLVLCLEICQPMKAWSVNDQN